MMMHTRTYRVFLVDSRSMFRQGLRALLRHFPDVVVAGEAADGLTMLELARERSPDVVLIGAQLSGADILQTTANIRREMPRANVIILTTDAEDSTFIFQAIRTGARGCISQDSDIEDLVKAIRLVGQGQAVLAPQSLTDLINLITQPESPTEHTRVLDRLTNREREVLNLISQGITNREIAERLCVTESTVRSHIHSILDKLQLTNRVQAATFALTARRTDRAEPRTLPVPASREECPV